MPFFKKVFLKNGSINKLLQMDNIEIRKANQSDIELLQNIGRQTFYEKNGFKAFSKHIFMLGDDPQTDIMMKIELNDPKTN